jgi:hypothetical protein
MKKVWLLFVSLTMLAWAADLPLKYGTVYRSYGKIDGLYHYMKFENVDGEIVYYEAVSPARELPADQVEEGGWPVDVDGNHLYIDDGRFEAIVESPRKIRLLLDGMKIPHKAMASVVGGEYVEKVKAKTEAKVEQKTDEAIDRALDKTLEKMFDSLLN